MMSSLKDCGTLAKRNESLSQGQQSPNLDMSITKKEQSRSDQFKRY